MTALCKLFNCSFIIHTNNKADIAISCEGHALPTFVYHLAYHLNEHYNCLIRFDDDLDNGLVKQNADNWPVPLQLAYYFLIFIIFAIPLLYLTGKFNKH